MAISQLDMQTVYNAIQKAIDNIKAEVVQDVVLRNDTQKNLIWTKKFGDEPIPLFMFDAKVKYYDTLNTGIVQVKTAILKPVCPSVGDVVLIMAQFGSRNLPKCIGVLQSRFG